MILDRLESSASYDRMGPNIARALAFLRDPATANLPDGRHSLDGERCFAIVQHYTSKLFDECGWEAHRRYIDVQYVVAGVERMGVSHISRMRVIQPYDPERELAIFDGDGDFFTVEAGMFAVFFPHDVHMPQLAAGAPALVRKIVVKVAAE